MSRQKTKYQYEPYQKRVTLTPDQDIEPYHIVLPDAPEPEFIGNYGLPKEQQLFQKETIPKKIWELTNAINNGEIIREAAIESVKRDSELCSFIESQWHKRIHGDFQYIYGKIYYLTGQYWFYLNYYLMPLDKNKTGTPGFRETDWEEHLWWKYCVEENDSVCGGIGFTARRTGKSFKGGNTLIEHGTRTPNTYNGMQSKSEDDAEEFFRKCVTFQFKRLPFFFKPEYDKLGKMSSTIKMVSEDVTKSFESQITYKSTTATAFDGSELGRWIGDEFGKMVKPANPIAIWDKNKYCFYNQGKLRGKARIDTTVEEMTRGGGEEFHYLWNKSSRKKANLNAYGETSTGLVQYFTSSYRNIFFDQYGLCIVDKPKPHQAEWRKKQGDKFWNLGGREYIDEQINSKKGSDKQDQIRKTPRNVKEAFNYNNTGCLYDIDIINERLQYFREGYPIDFPMTYGYFKWVDGKEYQEAEFCGTDEKTARCHIRMLPLLEQRNKHFMKNGKQTPANFMWFNMGCDPFKLKTDQVQRKDRMSQGAGHVYSIFNPNIDPIGKPRDMWLTDNYVLEYIYRPDTPDLFAEDMAMIAVFYGCKVFPEANIMVVDNHFRDHGLEEYLQFRWKPTQKGNVVTLKEDKKTAGAYTTETMMPTLVRQGINYIKRVGAYCPFPRTLEQFRDMTWDTLNEHDAAASGLYTLVGVFDKPKEKEKKKATIDWRTDIGVPRLTTSVSYN